MKERESQNSSELEQKKVKKEAKKIVCYPITNGITGVKSFKEALEASIIKSEV